MAASTLHLRSAYPAPDHPDGHSTVSLDCGHRVTVRHPGYDDAHNVLMVLPAYDHPDGAIYHETARIACAIIADNRWDGYFTATRNGSRLDVPTHGLLPIGSYYFQVPKEQNADHENPDEPFLYHVIPRFRDWRFPHSRLPESWSSKGITNFKKKAPGSQRTISSGAVYGRDLTCRLSGSEESTQTAHLIPRAEDDWYTKNLMSQYQGNTAGNLTEATDDPSNTLLLREDLHTSFDKRRLVFVPKKSSSQSPSITTHVIALSVDELVRLYHNVPLLPLEGLSIEFLFARFAWTIFPLLHIFLLAGEERMLCIYKPGSQIVPDSFTGDQCREIFKSPPSPRSVSPKKRSRQAHTEQITDGLHDSVKGEASEEQQAEQVAEMLQPTFKQRLCDQNELEKIHEANTEKRTDETNAPIKRENKDQQVEQELGTSLPASKRKRCDRHECDESYCQSFEDLKYVMPSSFKANRLCTTNTEDGSENLEQLVLECLRKERMSADDSAWQEEVSWYTVYGSGPMTPNSRKRAAEFMGYEVLANGNAS